MDSGFYSAVSGLEAYLHAQEVSAQNLANVSTTGFKRRVAVFEPFQSLLDAELDNPGGTQLKGLVVDFSAGPMQQTDNPLDLAIQGDGFFVLQGPSGYVYTRKGNFTLSGEGTVVDSVGRPLLGLGGSRLTVPSGTRELRVDPQGRVVADDTEVGQVWIADVPEPSVLLPAAYTAFSLPEGTREPAPVAEPRVVQGALEGSNTNAVDELVSMITTLRGFEAAQRVLRSMDDSVEELAKAAGAAGS